MANYLKTTGIAALLLAGTSISSMATLVGLPYTSGDYATWDQFTAVTFTDQVADVSGGSAFSSTLTSASGGFVTGGGDRIYSGAGANDAALSFTINVDVNTFIDSFYLALKFTEPNGTANPALTFLNNFTVTLNGNPHTTPTFLHLTGESIGSPPNIQNIGVVQWAWTGLSFNPLDSFTISISSPARTVPAAGHVSVDALSVSTIPEPHTTALIAISVIMGIGLILRKRKATS